jgi:very-short-patch-repair endonuclease
MKYHKIKKIARELRRNQTAAERTLWPYISDRKLDGRKFLRQHAIIFESKNNDHAFFIPDFYCSSERLIIELDGPIHDYQKERDNWRDGILESMGYRVLRIKNEELVNIDLVLQKIRSEFTDQYPSFPKRRGQGWINKR